DRDEVALAVPRRGLKHMADAPKVAFTLFPDIAQSQHRTLESNSVFLCRSEDPKHGHEACAVVGDAGQMDNMAFSNKIERRGCRKHGGDVRPEHDRIVSALRKGGEHVSKFISRGSKTHRAEFIGKCAAARLLAEWRSGNHGQADLIFFDARLVLAEES